MKRSWYAVRVGKTPGVYDDWPSCLQNVTGVRCPIFKKFKNEQDANTFAFPEKSEEIRRDVTASLVAPPIPVEEVLAYQNRSAPCHCWLGISTRRPGYISVWFGEEDPRNFSGKYQAGGALTNTRLGISAFSRAISIVVKSNRDHPDRKHDHLFIHCPSKYLKDAVKKMLPRWARTGWSDIKDDDNKKLYMNLFSHIRSVEGSVLVEAVMDSSTGDSFPNVEFARRLAEGARSV